MLLTLILFGSQIKSILGEETGESTCQGKKIVTYINSIPFVFCTLVRCECVGFKVTGIKFMAVFITRRNAVCFLAGFTTILPLCLPGNFTFYAPFGLQQSASCYA